MLSHIRRQDSGGQDHLERVRVARWGLGEEGTEAVVAEHAEEGDGVEVFERAFDAEDLGQRSVGVDLRDITISTRSR